MSPKNVYQQTKPNRSLPYEEEYNPNANPPRFSFKYLTKQHDFSYESLNDEHKIALSNTLTRLSLYNWSELSLIDRHKKGYEIINRNSLKFTLPKGIPSNVSIITFRFYGKAPMLPKFIFNI